MYQNKPHIKKGLIVAILLIIIDIITHFLNIAQTQHQFINVFTLCILLFAASNSSFTFTRNLLDDNEPITFMNLFLHGFKVVVVATAIYCLYFLLAIKLIFPNDMDTYFKLMLDQIQKAKVPYDSNYVDQNQSLIEKIISISMLAGIIILNLLVGVLGALIGAVMGMMSINDKRKLN
ncbi:MAG: DUF4199 domain-containing protein [Phycisphaerales bacterium]|nr:DUF4199 domain-containing protein [Phycisphaerales bacterium]